MSLYNSMDSTADRQRPILIASLEKKKKKKRRTREASFAWELKIEQSLVAAVHALDKRDRKSISLLEVGLHGIQICHSYPQNRHS